MGERSVCGCELFNDKVRGASISSPSSIGDGTNTSPPGDSVLNPRVFDGQAYSPKLFSLGVLSNMSPVGDVLIPSPELRDGIVQLPPSNW